MALLHYAVIAALIVAVWLLLSSLLSTGVVPREGRQIGTGP
jgi:hypothetical protein